MGKRRESFEAVQKSVVRIKDRDGRTWGTGFFVSSEGHLLTCAHVIRDAGGWRNVRVKDQPVTCLYEGDPDRDDFAILQVEDTEVTVAQLEKDFDPGDEFISFGFSNDEFYGAPIRGEITAFARCGVLGDQKLIRLETFSDAQRIEGGQSGAPVFVFQKGKYKAVGLIVASEDLNGGLAIPSSTVIINSDLRRKLSANIDYVSRLINSLILMIIAILPIWLFFQVNPPGLFSNNCSSDQITKLISKIEKSTEERNIESALISADESIKKCKDEGLLLAKSKALILKEDYEQIINILKEIVSNRQSVYRVEATYFLGIAYYNLKDCQKALQEFEKIEYDPEYQLKVFYNMGLCYSALEDWNRSITKLEYVAEKAGKLARKRSGERTNLFIYYEYSIKKLSDIYANLAYENKGTQKEANYLDYFINYYNENLEKVIDRNQIKPVLDDRNNYVLGRSKTPSNIYAYIYKTEKFKNLLCRLYKRNGYEVPKNLENGCS